MLLSIIVATDLDDGFSKNNTIPWKLKYDLENFRKITTCSDNRKINVLIMGRTTFETLNSKPLKNRINIVLTRSNNISPSNDFYTSNSIEDALQLIQSFSNINEVFFIGGEEVYKKAFNLNITTIYKTLVHVNYECDRFFPKICSEWSNITDKAICSENNVCYHYEIYKKLKK